MSRSSSRTFKPPRPASWRQPDGARVLLETSHALPLVDIDIGFGVGSLHDPPGKEGLSVLTSRILRMGPRGRSAKRFEEEIARLGARLSIETSPRFIRVRGQVIERNVEPLLARVAEMLRDPGFRDNDFAQAKRQAQAALTSLLDDDRALAANFFRTALFAGHPFGRPSAGDRKSIRRIRQQDVIDFYNRRLKRAPIVFGVAGAIDREPLEEMLEEHFTGVSQGLLSNVPVPPPKLDKGRRVVIVDKPNRSQAQLFMGTLSLRTRDPLLFPMIVSNTAFGGTFTARLMNEVRSERGWSYGAYSRLTHEQQRDAWYMWTVPSAAYVGECAALQLGLMEEWVDRGITADECRFAKRYLVNSHCFDIDTPAKRLDAEMDGLLLGLPRRYIHEFPTLIREVTLSRAREATQRRISFRDLVIVVLGTASEIKPQFENLPGVTSLEVVPYDG